MPIDNDSDDEAMQQGAVGGASIINDNARGASSGITAEFPLEWTQLGVKADDAMPLRYPHDVAELLPTDLDICVVGTAGQKITQIPPDFWKLCNPNLETLVLRSHLISKMQGIEGFTKLELLELYDNQVQALECLEVPGPKLRILDMSYNSIRDMSPVGLCGNLQELCKFGLGPFYNVGMKWEIVEMDGIH